MKAQLLYAGLALASLVQADTLYLKSGRALSGSFVNGNSRTISFLEQGGRTQRFPITDVQRVLFGDGSSLPTAGGSDQLGGRPADAATAQHLIPTGTVITVRTIDSIDSNANNAGETFRASLDEPIIVNGRTVAQKGADAMVRVVRVNQSGTLSGTEEVALELAEVTAEGRRYTVQTSHAQVAAKSRGKDTAKVVGGTAVLGAIIGAIAGGGKGAAIGAASGAGAGAAIQAIRGQRVQIPSESKLDFTISQPVTQ